MKLPENVSESVRRLNKHLYGQENHSGGTASGSKPEQIVWDESLEAPQGKESNAGRFLVRITSFRRRLIDPDNLCAKYFVDCCRYCGAIPNDRYEDIELAVTQKKVASKKDERTAIEIEAL